MKTKKPQASPFRNLGRLIEDHFKKGLNKVEEIFKDTRAADDKLFSYFRVFIDDKGVASVTPSSRYLIERVMKAMDVRNAHQVVEYGAAEGVMTRRILDRMPSNGRILAIELNEKLFKSLKCINDPRLIAYRGDARDVGALAKKFGLDKVDVVVSGIPFAFLSRDGRHELLSDTARVLRPGGRFVAYQVTTHLIHPLNEHFSRVKTEFEIRNIPPNFIFTAFK
ncbi:MAG: methyltransferase domain-containing protein [Elusimicrobia bacterium]|nr:methyltransferase domain-containing protein [Elusimicrobiota bacterium]